MSHEIVYSSATRGLKPGSKGFCTVASTRNLSKPLAEKLEALSGYRHIFSPGDERNPITHAHVVLTIARKKYHVLSRIADAGYDFSQRSNKIAHHIALASEELVAGGPACLLSQDEFLIKEWEGGPRFFEHQRLIPDVTLEPGVCHYWQDVCGDAGWAGVLAESVWIPEKDQVYLICSQDLDMLRLILESQALLPPNARWSATFTTNFTRLAPNIECRWRCVLDGSPEADKIRRMHHVTVIDLTSPLEPPPDTPAVEAARKGKSLGTERMETEREAVAIEELVPAPEPHQASAHSSAVPPQPEHKQDLEVAPPAVPPPRSPRQLHSEPTESIGKQYNKSYYLISLIAILFCAMLAFVGGYLFHSFALDGPTQPTAEMVASESSTKQHQQHTSEAERHSKEPQGSETKPESNLPSKDETTATEGQGGEKANKDDGGLAVPEASCEAHSEDTLKHKDTTAPNSPGTSDGDPANENTDSGADSANKTDKRPNSPDFEESICLDMPTFPSDSTKTEKKLGHLNGFSIERLNFINPYFDVKQSDEDDLTWHIVNRKDARKSIDAEIRVQNDDELLFQYRTAVRSDLPRLNRGFLTIQWNAEGDTEPHKVYLDCHRDNGDGEGDMYRIPLTFANVDQKPDTETLDFGNMEHVIKITDIRIEDSTGTFPPRPPQSEPSTLCKIDAKSSKALQLQVTCKRNPDGSFRLQSCCLWDGQELGKKLRSSLVPEVRSKFPRVERKIKETQRQLSHISNDNKSKDKKRELQNTLDRLKQEKNDLSLFYKESSNSVYFHYSKANQTFTVYVGLGLEIEDETIPVLKEDIINPQ